MKEKLFSPTELSSGKSSSPRSLNEKVFDLSPPTPSFKILDRTDILNLYPQLQSTSQPPTSPNNQSPTTSLPSQCLPLPVLVLVPPPPLLLLLVQLQLRSPLSSLPPLPRPTPEVRRERPKKKM
jgi:hypothetical protein